MLKLLTFQSGLGGLGSVLSCLVSGGAPRDHLSVVLLRGEEELGRQPVGKGEPAEVMFTVQPRREDHGTNFSCRSELDLRSQGLELFQNTSAPRKLQTYVLPSTDPHLEAPRVVEVGSRRPVKCTLDGLFPAWDAEVYLVLGDQKLKSNTMYNGDSVLAEAWLEENEEGTHSLKCSVNLCRATSTRGRVTREVVLNVLREFEFWDGQGRGHLASSTLTAVLCPPHRRPEYPGHCHSSSSCGPHLGCSGHCRLHLQLPAEDPDIRAFWVRVSPDFKAVPLGGSLWLNCSSSCPLPEGSSLRTELRREQPSSVILEPPVLTGSDYTLRCHVTHVFPVRFFVVTLRRGGRVIYSESLERFTGLDLANVTLTYLLPSRPGDSGQPVTCHARLNLDGQVVLSSSSPVTLPVPAWSPVSKALASTSIAGCVGIFLLVGALCLRKYLSMQPPA